MTKKTSKRFEYRPRPVGLRPRRSTRSLRPVASRSAALLRDVRDPAAVVAWLCPRCGDWVAPGRFSTVSGLCRRCTDHVKALAEGGGRRG